MKNTYITEEQAKLEGFTVLAGPFLEKEMPMAYKIIEEVKRNHKKAILVQQIKKTKRKGCIGMHCEIWQKP